MKILYIIDFFNYNYNYREVYYAKEMAKKHDVYVLASNYDNTLRQKDKFEKKIEEWEDVTIFREKPLFKIKNTIFSLSNYKSIIKNVDPDIIHTFEGIKICTSIIGIWARKNGYLVFYDQENRKHGDWTLKGKLKYHLLQKHFEKKLVENVDFIRTVTPGARKYLNDLYDIDVEKISVNTLGYDKKVFFEDKSLRKEFRNENKYKDREILLGVSGKFYEQKKIELIIEGFKKLKKNEFKLIIKGKFKGNYYNKLCSKYKDTNNIKIKNEFMDSKQLNKFYNGVDLMIWTRQTISIFEALGTKTPVLIPYINSTSHLCNMTEGVFYFGKDFSLLTDNEEFINIGLAIKDIYKQISNKNYLNQSVEIRNSTFQWENIVLNLEREYKKLLLC